ncbi:MAG: STAS domain-containing protein [Clostridia bacterium]|nr:STAS domain-containing protein [Clostridia bacterium]
MNIIKTQNAGALNIALEGSLNTTTAPLLEAELKTSLDGISELVLDFAKLDYISSAGLRVLLSAQKVMAKTGKMKVIHANESIMEIFDITGFSDILNIE